MKGDFYARQMDGRYECSVDESNLLAEHTEAAAAIKDWFSKVQENRMQHKTGGKRNGSS